MSAGQAARSSLRSVRLRLALGVTTAAVALAVGGSLSTAHADTARQAPHHKSDAVNVALCDDPTPTPAPVDAVPEGVVANPKPLPQRSYSVLVGCLPPTREPGRRRCRLHRPSPPTSASPVSTSSTHTAA
ncbi:hypothetical protein SAMN05216489_00890 [Streptomyces sp. 3213]|nr:hypothetical protein SAMN05216489_00890 [Streptomyces sp. 3213] [Streptomyces sp. 3213.3]